MSLRAIGSSFAAAGPLMYLVNGKILKGIESYIKHMIDEIREHFKKRDLKKVLVVTKRLYSVEIWILMK